MINNDNNLRRFDKYAVDLEKKILWYEDEPCALPVKAVEMLCVLIENAGQVVGKEELLDAVWPDSFVEESVLSQNVYFLRKTFKNHGVEDELIQTVPRRGYRFSGEIAETEPENVVIERRTIERKLVVESDFPFEVFGEARDRTESPAIPAQNIAAPTARELFESRAPRFSLSNMPAAHLAGLVITLILAGGIFLIYSNRTNRNSAQAFSFSVDNIGYELVSESGRVVAVGLSPDNQHAVYVVNTADNLYEMILHHLPTGSETAIVKPQKTHLADIRFSPDGHYIYYIGNYADEKLAVYKMPLYGGVSQPVLRDLVHYFSVSPDGEWLAFLRRVPEESAHYLEIARSRDGSQRHTVAIRRDKEFFSVWGTAPAWSPDGRKLIAAAFTKNADETKPAKSHLVEIDVASGRQVPVKSPDHWHEVHEPYYAPDGRSVYLKVRENRGDPVQLWQLQLPSGEARNLTNDTNDYREFRVASDESFLITAVWSKSENLFLVSTDEPSRVRQLTFDSQGQNGVEGLAWTPDGRNLVYTRTKGFGVGNIWLMNVATGETRQLTEEKETAYGRIDVTADGRSLVYASSRTGTYQIRRMEFDGANQKQLTGGGSVDFSEISQDGQWIYYADRGLWKIPVTGGEPVRLMKQSPGKVNFSPTDPNVFAAFIHDDRENNENPWKHVIFDLDTLPIYRDLKIGKSSGLAGWTPNGQKIYYIGEGESFNNVWTVSPETLETEQLTSFQDQRISNMSLAPDGRTIAVSRGAAIGKIIKINRYR